MKTKRGTPASKAAWNSCREPVRLTPKKAAGLPWLPRPRLRVLATARPRGRRRRPRRQAAPPRRRRPARRAATRRPRPRPRSRRGHSPAGASSAGGGRRGRGGARGSAHEASRPRDRDLHDGLLRRRTGARLERSCAPAPRIILSRLVADRRATRLATASRRGQTNGCQIAKRFGKKPQVSRHRTSRRMPRSMCPPRRTLRYELTSVSPTGARNLDDIEESQFDDAPRRGAMAGGVRLA